MYWPNTDTDTRIGAALVSGKDSQNFSPEDDFQYVYVIHFLTFNNVTNANIITHL